jgi:uncharacterized membrane protein
VTDTLPPSAPAPAPLPATPRKNTIGLVALILALVAFVTAVIPAAAGSTWLFAAAAIVLAIISFVQKRTPRWTSLVAIIVAPIAWIIAIIVVIVVGLSGVGQAIEDAVEDAPPAAV